MLGLVLIVLKIGADPCCGVVPLALNRVRSGGVLATKWLQQLVLHFHLVHFTFDRLFFAYNFFVCFSCA
jgi:hypothetical protein